MPVTINCSDGKIEAEDEMKQVSPKIESAMGELTVESPVRHIEWVINYFKKHEYKEPEVLSKPLRSNFMGFNFHTQNSTFV